MAVNRASAAGNPPAWLNGGGIPSKALLHSSGAAVALRAVWHGIMLGCVYLNVRRAMLRKRREVDRIQRQCAWQHTIGLLGTGRAPNTNAAGASGQVGWSCTQLAMQ